MSREAAAEPATPLAEPDISAAQRRTVGTGLLIAMFIAALASTVVTTGLPTIAGELGGVDKVSWVVAGHLLTNCAATPLWGKLSDLYGRKPLLLTAIGVFTAGTALCGFADGIWQLIAFRAVQGAGVGGMITLCQAVIGDIVATAERGRWQGWIGAAFASSTAIGPLLGGVFVDTVGWRWCFFAMLPFAVLAFVVIQRSLTLPPRRADVSVDYAGALLLVSGVSALLLLVSFGGQRFAWTSGTAYALGGTALALLAATALWERRAAEPLWPPRMFRSRSFTAQCASAFLMGTGMYASMVYLPQLYQLGRGFSATEAGLLTLPFIAANFVGSTTSGRLIGRTGRVKPFPVIGMALSTAAAVLFAWQVRATDAPAVALWPAMVVAGLGIGFTSQVLILAAQTTVERRDLGVATSSISFFRTLGGTISTAVFGAVIARRFTDTLPDALAAHGAAEAGGPGLPAGGTALPRPEALRGYPQALQDAVHDAYSAGISGVYLVVIPCTLLGLAAAASMRDTRLPVKRAGADKASVRGT
ncbi:MDR family MFS transporter [Yinghuangia seranimata]|uniref:MDR family MFS transporter n=1 Tax=Yinghuangia seranimata TaxID=408067 RepID=UPI00248C98C1|nr:MDR family MFS transporter [Yinghuangia seranimata]MDI2127934.1 MDR family MFS transporter [Yinghuangia seranimata]